MVAGLRGLLPEGSIKVTDKGLEVDLESWSTASPAANLCYQHGGVKSTTVSITSPPRAPHRRLGARADDDQGGEGEGLLPSISAMDISPSCDCYGWTDTPIVNGPRDPGVL